VLIIDADSFVFIYVIQHPASLL